MRDLCDQTGVCYMFFMNTHNPLPISLAQMKYHANRLDMWVSCHYNYGIHSFRSSSKQWLTQYMKGILSSLRPGMMLYTWYLLTDGSPTACVRKSPSSWWPGHLAEMQAGPQWNFTEGKLLLQTPSTMANTCISTSEGSIPWWLQIRCSKNHVTYR